MRIIVLAALLGLAAPALAHDPSEANVNSRYTVESVQVEGVSQSRLGRKLRHDLDRLVGQKFNQKRIDELTARLKDAFPGETVTHKVERGDQPDSVRLVFTLSEKQENRFDLSVPIGLYDSKEGWSGEIDAVGRVGANTFTGGIVSDSDPLLARFAGIRAQYDNSHLGTDVVGMRFLFESYHEQWNPATQVALASAPEVPGIYRTRQNFAPSLRLKPIRPLEMSFGVSFQRMQMQYPAAHTEAANAVTFTLRYDRQLEGSGVNRQRLAAGYDLRAATTIFDSDFLYTRHFWDASYSLARGHNVLNLHFISGTITGRPPLFERFVLGNSQTLRGWNKFDVAPLGGTRMAHNSLDYRFKALRLFYDVGSDWNRGERAAVRHAAGAGLRFGDFSFLVGFPIRAGRADPIFMLGLNL